MLSLRQRVQAVLERESLDAIVASAPENVYYVSGYHSVGGSVIRGVQLYAVLNSESLVLVLSRSDVPCALEEGLSEDELLSYGSFHFDRDEDESQRGFSADVQSVLDKSVGTPIEALTAALERMAGSGKAVAVDRTGVPPEVWDVLTERYGNPQLRNAAGLFRSIRSVKTEEETGRIERATRIVEDAVFGTLEQVREGMTEREMVRIFEQHVIADQGQPWFAVITCGERAAFADAGPTSRPLGKL